MTNNKTVSDKSGRSADELLEVWAAANRDWTDAIEAHVMAPPDPGFAGRLAELARTSAVLAQASRETAAAGFTSAPARKANSEPPYELRPGTGRRGPEELWLRFDRAVRGMIVAAAGTDLEELADAYEQLADLAGQLTEAVAAEDKAAMPRRARAGRVA